MLETIWFVLWGVLWTVYFVLDGFDLGLGSTFLFLAKSEDERRVAVNAMGPFWDGNEVWLITAGGVTFAAFPAAYATMFSVLYVPLMLLLFALIIRGVSFEFRNKVDDSGWRDLWDRCLAVGSFLPALLFGVAFANIFRGLTFTVNPPQNDTLLDLLNPYGLLGGLLFVALFVVHGALWLAAKSEGDLRRRAETTVKWAWPVEVVLAVAFLVASAFATPLWENYGKWPVLLVLPLLAVAGLVMLRVALARGRRWAAWGWSAAAIAGAVLWGVGGLYPRLFWSRRDIDPGATLTAHNAASSPLTLKIMLGVALVMVPIVIAYQTWVYLKFRDVVRPEDFREHDAY